MHGLNDPRTLIGLAVGILMERHDLDPDGAFRALMKVATREERQVADAARNIVRNRRLGRSGLDSALVETYQAPQVAASASTISGELSELSEREMQVLTLIAQGATNGQIADTLHLGLNTVKTYIRTAYRKIGATRRTQAVIWGIDHGLSEPAHSSER